MKRYHTYDILYDEDELCLTTYFNNFKVGGFGLYHNIDAFFFLNSNTFRYNNSLGPATEICIQVETDQ